VSAHEALAFALEVRVVARAVVVAELELGDDAEAELDDDAEPTAVRGSSPRSVCSAPEPSTSVISVTSAAIEAGMRRVEPWAEVATAPATLMPV
jgi:hypothetical protein